MHFFIFGNCQGLGISELINSYTECSASHLYNYKNISYGAGNIDQHVIEEIKKADYLVYQPLDKKWGVYSEIENIAVSINPKIKCCSFPYIYLEGFWPIYPENEKNNRGR